MHRLDMYPGASLLRTLYMNKPLLYSSCFCRLIILISNFWSVVRDVSGRIKFTALLCREFNLFLRTSLHPRFNVGIEEQFPGVDVYDVP